jgi:hypothetical protein
MELAYNHTPACEYFYMLVSFDYHSFLKVSDVTPK